MPVVIRNGVARQTGFVRDTDIRVEHYLTVQAAQRWWNDGAPRPVEAWFDQYMRREQIPQEPAPELLDDIVDEPPMEPVAAPDIGGMINELRLNRKPRKTYEDLEPVNGECLHGISMPDFKLNYTSAEEITRRLLGSVIVVNGSPYYVTEIQGEQDFILALQNGDGVTKAFPFAKVSSLRSCPPGYVNFNEGNYHGAYWLYRRPSSPADRHGDYSQGVTQRNSFLRRTGAKGHNNHHNLPNLTHVVRALSNRSVLPWQNIMGDLLAKGVLGPTRLNNQVAVYYDDKNVNVEYKNRFLGVLNDKTVTLSDEDIETPWIIRELKSVGLQPQQT